VVVVAIKVNIVHDYSTVREIALATGEDPATIDEDRIGAAVVMCPSLGRDARGMMMMMVMMMMMMRRRRMLIVIR
jgi:hypothetical protein